MSMQAAHWTECFITKAFQTIAFGIACVKCAKQTYEEYKNNLRSCSLSFILFIVSVILNMNFVNLKNWLLNNLRTVGFKKSF